MRLGRLVIALALLVVTSAAGPETVLRVYVTAQARPDVMREALDRFQRENPGIVAEIETGGSTSELQSQYLNTTLSASDPSLDVFLLDVVRPAQFAASDWLVPLDNVVGNKTAFLKQYLPAYAEADDVGGKLVALPAFADAMFLYYRSDLLKKYHLPVPKDWNGLARESQTILRGEHRPALQGVSFQGAAIEGSVCTFLLPYWSQGDTLGTPGHLEFNDAAAARSLGLWSDFVHKGVAPANAGEVTTDQTRQDFEAGNAVFAVLWSYGWGYFQGTDSAVRGKTAVAPLPAMPDGRSVSCLGGWQWGVSAFTRHRPEATRLVRFLATPYVAKLLSVKAGVLPALTALYTDRDVLAANPWYSEVRAIMQTAHARPVTPRYNETSYVIRTTVNAVLAGITTPTTGAAEIGSGLKRTMR